MKPSSQAALAGLAVALSACGNMANQPKRNPYELPYGVQARWPLTPPPHTIARDDPLNPPAPPPVTMALLERGRQRFNINCSPCHGRTGEGDGMIVQRGFPPPPNYNSDKLRKAPAQLFYNVITRGYGLMYPYYDRVTPADRWAIAAYIRALQASFNAKIDEVPSSEREALK